jgi:hypothetical protein
VYLAVALCLLGRIAEAAQMPEQFRGDWRTYEQAPDFRGARGSGFSAGSCESDSDCKKSAPEELFHVTPSGIEAASVQCAATRVTKFDTCPWGQQSKRPSQRNPWGPGYNVSLQCREKNGRTFSAVHDWIIEKGELRLMTVPSGYRCLLPHPTKPDLQ